MLIQRAQIRLHLPSAVVAAVVMTACLSLYVMESWASGRWVGGGSTSGLLCGSVAALVIVFEMLLWPRKLLRRFRLIATKYWMVAHIWFGLISLPLAIAHCGFHLGGHLPTAFMIIFVATILSGLYGLAVQNILPRWMLRNLPAETIYSQINHVSELAVGDLRRMLISSCGQRPVKADEYMIPDDDEFDATMTKTIIIGAIRQAGKSRGRALKSHAVIDARNDAATLWNAFDSIEPFLQNGQIADTPVTDRGDAGLWFKRLSSACHPSVQNLVETMEQLCDQRRQFDVQRKVHHHLHAWLPLHIGLSVATSVLLVLHVFTALKYW